MPVVRETKLPGVGVRHEFTTDEGKDMAVLVHRDGRREIMAYETDDPDACTTLVSLSEPDTQVLAEILGVSPVTETVAEIRHEIEGLAIEWFPLPAASELAGVSIGSGEFRMKTGASIVAVIRDDTAVPAPGADFELAAGDVLVAVGTGDGLGLLRSLLGEWIVAAGSADTALAFIEVGALVFGLGLLSRLAARLGVTAVPMYLIAGLALGEGGVVTLDVSEEFVSLAAEIGVLLLLFSLGLEYSDDELRDGLRTGLSSGLLDMVLNAGVGLAAGLLLGWSPLAALVLGGITWVSSSGVISKVLGDLDRLGNRETPVVLNLLVIEDLAMAVYLPVVAALIVGGTFAETVTSVAVALLVIAIILLMALRYGRDLSRRLGSTSNESLLLAVFGLVLLVAGGAQLFDVSGAIGAFLVGLALSGRTEERVMELIAPLRDLFAATFFVFFSFQIDIADLLATAGYAVVLTVLSSLAKVAAGWHAAAKRGVGARGRLRAGTVLIARGEFSIVIAALAGGLAESAQLGALAAGYVLLTAVFGPLSTRYADQISVLVARNRSPGSRRLGATQ